jgi:hypothetical protein
MGTGEGGGEEQRVMAQSDGKVTKKLTGSGWKCKWGSRSAGICRLDRATRPHVVGSCKYLTLHISADEGWGVTVSIGVCLHEKLL